MKKVFTIFLILVLMLGSMAVAVSAVGSGIASLISSAAEVYPGDTITVTFRITSNPGIFAMTYTPSYDTSRLKLVKLEGCDSNWMCNTTAQWMNNDLADDSFTGSVVTITFQVLDSAKVGTISIGGSVVAGNIDEEEISFTVTPCSIAVKAAPHTHSWDAGKVTKAAGCESKGVKTYTCSACGETKTEDISATGHSWDAGKITTAVGCESKGVKTYTCGNCGGTKTEDISATGHSWDAGKITTAAGCESKGIKTYTCGNCGETKTEDILATGHSWSDWTADEGKDTHTRTCGSCTKTETKNHAWDSGKVTQKALCIKVGERIYTCPTCKTTKTEEIAATGVHDYTKRYEYTEGEDVHYGFCFCGEKGPAEKHVYTQEGEVLEKATTTKQGKQEKLCVCGNKIVVTLDKIPAEYDNVPKTGDITGQLVLLGAAILLGIGGVCCLIKRKIAY